MPGIGLLMLRIALGITADIYGVALLVSPRGQTALEWIFGLSAIAGGLLILVGFLTPVICSAVCLGAIGIAAFSWLSLQDTSFLMSTVYVAVIALGLALLGPGAYSVDARMFGRREIIIPRMNDSPES